MPDAEGNATREEILERMAIPSSMNPVEEIDLDSQLTPSAGSAGTRIGSRTGSESFSVVGGAARPE